MCCKTTIVGFTLGVGLVAPFAVLAATTPHGGVQPGLPIPVCQPTGLAVNSDNELFVANHYSSGTSCYGGQILVYDSTGKQLTKRTITANIVNPQGLAFDSDGHLYVADRDGYGDYSIFEFSRTGKPLPAKTIALPDKYWQPLGVQIAPNHDVWVAENFSDEEGELQIFRHGKLVTSTNDNVSFPVGIAFQPGKKLGWVGNAPYEGYAEMVSFNLAGKLRQQYPADGFPVNYLAFENASTVIFTSTLEQDAVVYDTTTQNVVMTFQTGPAPNGIAIDGTGAINIANGGSGGYFNGSSIDKFDSSGNLLCTIINSGCY
jgi:hypothetical protein